MNKANTAADRPSGKIARSKAAAAALSTQAQRRAAKIREDFPAADAAWESYADDMRIGGPLISGAVAFRMFLWFLPFTLVTVVGFGLLADAGHESASTLVHTAGKRGIAAQSNSSATRISNGSRWLLLATGVFALLSTSHSLIKALWRSTELAWKLPRHKLPSRTHSLALLFLVAAVTFAVSAAASDLRHDHDPVAVPVSIGLLAVWSGLWLIVSLALPHSEAPWTALLPGAFLVGGAIEVLRVVTIYYLANRVGSSTAIYGGLGAAAVLLTWFYVIARVMVAAAVLNSTLWARRCRGTANGLRKGTAS